MSVNHHSHQFYATCPKGLEGLLLEELKDLAVEAPRETAGGVYFSGDIATAYRCCLWSRLANRVLFPLASIKASSEAEIYKGATDIPWEDHLEADGRFKVDFSGVNAAIRNTQFGAIRIKDAIVDRFRERTHTRPSVSKDDPDLVINARLSHGVVHLAVDLSGYSLHRRGYRTRQGAAPLKENLAVAILLRAGWSAIAAKEHTALIDPMCGSATLLIEGLLMAADIAPGIYRKHWGFSRWQQFDPTDWAPLWEDAQARKAQGLERLRGNGIECRGYDQDPKVLRAAESNIARAGLHGLVRVSRKLVEQCKQPTHTEVKTGLVICNPPYGERLGEEEALLPVYRQLGQVLKQEFLGWQAAVFTANQRLAKNMGVRARKRYKLFNGALATDVLCFSIEESFFVKQETLDREQTQHTHSTTTDDGADATHTRPTLTPGAQMVCNRLQKNLKQLRKWRKQYEIESFRLYDADMPEYAAAVDCYGDWVHVQEYAAPKSIDPVKAQYRFDELLNAVQVALDKDRDQIFIKQRRRNKGKQQYERLEESANRAKIPVKEGHATLLVDLWSYLDTGLFLDHRPVRQHITTLVNGKSFLNLFCYTATATVHAALAGAASSVSVDMSNTYLEWAGENFEANNIHPSRHQLVSQNCITWLEQCRQGFDVILLDPPSFSNSKRMEDSFDVQRDHTALVHRCMDLLNPGGTLIFSNNLRSFTLDTALNERYLVEDITAKTIDPDFQRNRKIHQCFLVHE